MLNYGVVPSPRLQKAHQMCGRYERFTPFVQYRVDDLVGALVDFEQRHVTNRRAFLPPTPSRIPYLDTGVQPSIICVFTKYGQMNVVTTLSACMDCSSSVSDCMRPRTANLDELRTMSQHTCAHTPIGGTVGDGEMTCARADHHYVAAIAFDHAVQIWLQCLHDRFSIVLKRTHPQTAEYVYFVRLAQTFLG